MIVGFKWIGKAHKPVGENARRLKAEEEEKDRVNNANTNSILD
jgi:hypothetical protein